MVKGDVSGSCVDQLAELFETLEDNQRIGTLKLDSPDPGPGDAGRPDTGKTVYIYFNRGVIQFAKTSAHKTLLGRALIKRRRITEAQLKAALKRQKQAPESIRLGQILTQSGLVTNEDIQEALAFQMAEEIFTCFTWESFEQVFYRGEPPLDIFDEEDREFRVALRPSLLGQEAKRRAREIRKIRKLVPSYHDVCVITTDSNLLNEGSHERELINLIDGRRDVAEFLEALPAQDFVGLRVLAKLLGHGQAARLDGDQLITLGQELEELSQYRRARKRYMRALDIGHSDFELHRRLGQVEEALNNNKRAVRRYLEYAEQCRGHEFYDVAIETLRHCLALETDHVEALQALGELLEQTGETDQAVAAFYEVGQLLQDRDGDKDEIQKIWYKIAKLQPDNIEARETLAHLYLENGDRTEALMEFQEVATLYLAEDNLEAAIPLLRKAHELDPAEIFVHESLATTLARLGREQDALTEFLSLAKNLEKTDEAGIFKQHLTTIYEKITQIDPAHSEARAWLASAYESKKNSEKAVENYKGMLPSVRDAGDDDKLLELLEKIHNLNPTDQEVTQEFAQLLEKMGKPDRSVELLVQIAETAAAEGKHERERSVLTDLLKLRPGRFEAHLSLARLESTEDSKKHTASLRMRGMAQLLQCTGDLEGAEEMLRRAVSLRDEDALLRTELAALLVKLGRKEAAVKEYLKAGKQFQAQENTGLSKANCQAILALDGDNADAHKLLKDLEKRAVKAPAAAPRIELSSPAAPEKPKPKPMPTITGGGKASVHVVGGKTRRLSSVNKLKSLLFNRGPVSQSEPTIIKKASKGINKLKALRGGGAAGDNKPSPAVSQGPEGPGQALSEQASKKAKGGINKLKALRGGGASKGLGAGPAISTGPEGPGQALSDKASKKAKGGINKLKALRGGGSGGVKPAVSAGPEGPGEALSEAASKKAKGGINKLKALRGGGAKKGLGGVKPAVSQGPEGPGKALSEQASKKAKGGINKLKALRGGGASKGLGAGPAISTGPEGPGQALSDKASKKAKGGINKLKALRGGGSGGGLGGVKPAISAGPEGPGEALSDSVSKKASKGINKLKALRGGGSGGGLGGIKPAISAGPEGPGEALSDKASKKAKGGINKLKALRGGGGKKKGPGGVKPAISAGPEGPGQAVSENLSKKAASGINKLKALKLGKSQNS